MLDSSLIPPRDILTNLSSEEKMINTRINLLYKLVKVKEIIISQTNRIKLLLTVAKDNLKKGRKYGKRKNSRRKKANS